MVPVLPLPFKVFVVSAAAPENAVQQVPASVILLARRGKSAISAKPTWAYNSGGLRKPFLAPTFG